MTALERSRALWNRTALDLNSFEIVAQILDRGEVEAWRELYALAKTDGRLRQRIIRAVRRVPMTYGRFWLAAMASLGEPVDVGMPLPKLEYGT